MPRLLESEIPYPEDGDVSRLFEVVADRPWSIWLDSGSGHHSGAAHSARYDIIVAEPAITLVTREGVTAVTDEQGEVTASREEPLALLRQTLGRRNDVDLCGVPFAGGAVGYFGYDLARLWERLPEQAEDDLQLPQMAVGIYDWALVCDHQQQRCRLVSTRHHDPQASPWRTLVERFSAASRDDARRPEAPMRATGPVVCNMDREQYAAAFARIQHYLEEGDCYQVNLAQRFSLPVEGSAWSGYKQLRCHGAGPFSAYLNLPGVQILSTSPERFLRLERGQVETRPIKGTRRRLADALLDRQQQQALLGSEKDRAENLMIVDLLRNDLGKSCRTGTVKVPQLFTLESYATVHHLVSSVTCRLAEGEDALSLLQNCFPGGSITGAPKLRAMEIIEELEPHRRGVYCGSIGYIGFHGDMDSNIAIRTAVHHKQRLYYAAGGGIVRDSVCTEEYQESFDKAAAFLGSFPWQE